jgi:lysozyme
MPTPSGFDDIINLPAAMQIVKGVDVSHHNGTIDWGAIVNAGCEFAYIKMSDGVGTPDVNAPDNARNARNAGLKIGYFHFARPDTTNGGTIESDAIAEANEVYNTVVNLPGYDLPPMIDFEDVPNEGWDSPLAPDEYLLWITTFTRQLRANIPLPGKKFLLYSRKTYLENKLTAAPDLANDYKLWLSRYSADYNDAETINFWTDWDVWQFTQVGTIYPNSLIDLDIWKRDSYNDSVIPVLSA